jgi:hypothetical protein
MQDVPKIVTDRLRTVVPVVNHPDADVLTAFSEQSLPERDRATVLEHLALCGDCREIVILAQPAVEATQTTIRSAPTRWLVWPALRWGFVGVGAFAIASLGVVQYRKQLVHPGSTASMTRSEAIVKEAKNEAAPIADSSPTATDQEKVKLAAPASAAVAKGKAANVPAELDRLQAFTTLQKAENKARSAIRSGLGGLGAPVAHGPRVQYQNALNQNALNQNGLSWQANNGVSGTPPHGAATVPSPFSKQAPNSFMGADASPVAATQTVDTQAQNAPVEVQGRNTQSLQLETKNLELQPTEGGQGRTVESGKDSGLVMGVSRAKVPVSSPAMPDAFTGTLSAPNASWTITAGGLQRSLDQGKTWQSVSVNAPPAGGLSYALARQSSAKAADTKKETGSVSRDSAAQQVSVPPVFRAVVANGPDVWAGGSGTLLYHSVDSGGHWVRIIPSSGGTTMTGDIVTVDFPDVQHGKITTSAPEVWLTSDDGQTWQKQ